jgi:hypothetical protein
VKPKFVVDPPVFRETLTVTDPVAVAEAVHRYAVLYVVPTEYDCCNVHEDSEAPVDVGVFSVVPSEPEPMTTSTSPDCTETEEADRGEVVPEYEDAEDVTNETDTWPSFSYASVDPVTASVTVSVTAVEFCAACFTHTARHWPGPILPRETPVPDDDGEEYVRPVMEPPGAVSDAAVSAWAVDDPTAEAAVVSTAKDTFAPPAGSPPCNHTTVDWRVSVAWEL